MIQRPRLQARLVGRFEVPITTITAAAGSGKSSLISLVVDDNRLDPRGRDVVVTVRARDRERAPFLAKLARTLGVNDRIAADPELAVEAIDDAVWAAAPEDVVIWVDDAHVLDDDAVAALAELSRELPTNGHLAVVSRRALPLGLARLRAHGSLLEIDADDLELDDDELERLSASIGAEAAAEAAAAATPRHAATAALLAATGCSSASIAYLQEEVIGGLSIRRLDQLRRLVVVDRIDEELARHLTDDAELDLHALVKDLPLVADDGDTVQLHDLLREALASDLSPGELRKIRSLTGDALAARHDYLGAIDAHLAAGDEISARLVARRYVRRPTLAQAAIETRGIARRIAALDDDSPLLAALRATALQSSNVWSEELEAWRHTRDVAAGVDDEIEALALHRVAQSRFLDIDPWDEIDEEISDAYYRLEALAERVDLAAGAAAHIRSQAAQPEGDVERALDALEDYRYFDSPDDVMMRWQRLTDLGFVERVGENLGADDVAAMPPGGEVFLAYAMWLRGQGSPEQAEMAVSSMIDATGDRGQRVTVASSIGTGVPIALACGEVDVAAGRVARLRELDRFGLPRKVRLFIALAEGLLAAVQESDEVGAERLESFGRFATICGWPLRPHLLALPFLYLVQPQSRDVLDAMRTGPAITLALDAGRALVALREHDDPEPAAGLAWSAQNVLRNHVLPHHLAELACAADVAGHPGARTLLDALPDVERQLRRVADHGAPVAATRAIELLGDLPRTAPAELHLRLLGSPALERDAGAAESLAQRARPAEVLAILTIRGPMTRDDLIEAVWGGYDDDDKASANLRATLTQLQRLLEPDRARDVGPYHLRGDGQLLSLHGVTTDVDEFERHHREARQADTAGTPRTALASYLAAMDLYRGDLLTGHDTAWVVLDRVRLRSLASGASCRIAELLAARGEVEDAAEWARRALHHDPLSDRAAAAFVKALVANDDRGNAATALAKIIAERALAGVEVSPSLRQLAERLPMPG